jgi:hypothetical protein
LNTKKLTTAATKNSVIDHHTETPIPDEDTPRPTAVATTIANNATPAQKNTPTNSSKSSQSYRSPTTTSTTAIK